MYPNRRSREIQLICQEYNIDTLVHFTRSSNLSSILQRGLLSRDRLEKERRLQPYEYNDELRLDGYQQAISLSISFPNYKMFYRYRQQSSDDKWIVLVIKPEVLWKLDCAFFRENAASSNMKRLNLNELKSPNALEQLFSDYNNMKREDLEIPICYPTHPQAEVLVFERINPQYIREIHFYNESSANKWLNNNQTRGFNNFFYGSPYFSPRQDWRSW